MRLKLFVVAGLLLTTRPLCAEPVDTSEVEPILASYCYDCHGDGAEEGGIALDRLVADWKSAAGDPHAEEPLREGWERVLGLVRADVMPPAYMDQPSDEEKARLAEWIKRAPFRLDPERPDPGRVTLRRLNRTEYRNTIRDLMGVDYDTHADFPADGSGHGFDNLADVLTVSPLLMEKYIAAAREIVDQSVPKAPRVVAERRVPGGRFVAEGQEPDGGSRELTYYEPAEVQADYTVDTPGKYELVVKYRADESYVDGMFDLNECRFTYAADGETLHEATYTRQGGRRYVHRHEVDWDVGPHAIRFAVEPLSPGVEQVRSLRMNLEGVTVRGPLADEHWVEPKEYRRWFPRDVPADKDGQREYARELLNGFATRAFRRPAPAPTVDRLVEMVEASIGGGSTFEAGVARAMTAVLASPRFLFREELETDPRSSDVDGVEPHPLVDEYALASRLSYFLWSTTPDEELMRLAMEGRLRASLDEQFDRMFADPRSGEFVRNFVGQWLGSRDIEQANVNAFAVLARDRAPDPEAINRRRRFRELRRKEPEELTDPEKEELQEAQRAFFEAFRRTREFELDDDLRRAMRRETELVFEHVLREGRSALELIDSDYTFLNERLARHYGVEGIEGSEMRLVTLPPDSPRGGVLTQGTVLVNTSNPDRTSPVKRGLFVLENLVGTPPPPPPPDIPPLEDPEDETSPSALTLRESLAKHRDSPLCSSCHARMDPLGFALEPFNALGAQRDTDRGKPIDSAGTLVTGESFSDVNELKKILVADRRIDFYRCLTEKMMTYALGRGVEYYDTPTVDTLVAGLEQSGGDLRALVRAVVESPPFQRRRSEHAASTVTAQRTLSRSSR